MRCEAFQPCFNSTVFHNFTSLPNRVVSGLTVLFKHAPLVICKRIIFALKTKRRPPINAFLAVNSLK